MYLKPNSLDFERAKVLVNDVPDHGVVLHCCCLFLFGLSYLSHNTQSGRNHQQTKDHSSTGCFVDGRMDDLDEQKGTRDGTRAN